MSNFATFTGSLKSAVEIAEMNPRPSKKAYDATKAALKSGLTVGQARLVIQVYNSVLNTIKYNREKNENR
jgi:hypothetical protein